MRFKTHDLGIIWGLILDNLSNLDILYRKYSKKLPENGIIKGNLKLIKFVEWNIINS